MPLLPLDRARVVSELEIVSEKLHFLGGTSTGAIMAKNETGWVFREDDRLAYWHESIGDEPPKKKTRADVYRRAFERHSKILCTCRRRLAALLNDGDVDLFDCEHDTLTYLHMAWSVVEELPTEPVEFNLSGRQTLYGTSITGELICKIVIDHLKGDVTGKAHYLGDGLIQVNGVRHLITTKSQVKALERLVEDRVATGSSLGVSNAAKAIGELRKAHDSILAPYIIPSGKQKKGYTTTIEDGRPIRELLDKLVI